MSMFGNAAKTLGLGAVLWLGLAAQSAFADFPASTTWTGTYTTTTTTSGEHGTVIVTFDQYQAVTFDFKSATGQGEHQFPGSISSIDYGSDSSHNSLLSIHISGSEGIGAGVWEASASGGSYSGHPNSILGTWANGSDAGTFTVTLSSGGGGPVGDGTTSLTVAPQGATGEWYDPAYNGSGFNLTMTSVGMILYYYGWDKNHNRLWLMSDVGSTTITPGTPITLGMSQTNGGSFMSPANPSNSGVVSKWGTLQINFSNCNTATATLSGTDGNVPLNLVKLVGGLNAPPGC